MRLTRLAAVVAALLLAPLLAGSPAAATTVVDGYTVLGGHGTESDPYLTNVSPVWDHVNARVYVEPGRACWGPEMAVWVFSGAKRDYNEIRVPATFTPDPGKFSAGGSCVSGTFTTSAVPAGVQLGTTEHMVNHMSTPQHWAFSYPALPSRSVHVTYLRGATVGSFNGMRMWDKKGRPLRQHDGVVPAATKRRAVTWGIPITIRTWTNKPVTIQTRSIKKVKQRRKVRYRTGPWHTFRVGRTDAKGVYWLRGRGGYRGWTKAVGIDDFHALPERYRVVVPGDTGYDAVYWNLSGDE